MKKMMFLLPFVFVTMAQANEETKNVFAGMFRCTPTAEASADVRENVKSLDVLVDLAAMMSEKTEARAILVMTTTDGIAAFSDLMLVENAKTKAVSVDATQNGAAMKLTIQKNMSAVLELGPSDRGEGNEPFSCKSIFDGV